jgi:hypothetical protein
MQISIEVEFEQVGRIIRRPARVRAQGLGETQRVQILRPDEGIQEAHRVFGSDI